MLNISCEINGQKIDLRNRNVIEQTIINAVAEKGIEAVRSVLSQEEISKITITINGKSVDDLSLNISGPDEIIDKIKSSL